MLWLFAFSNCGRALFLSRLFEAAITVQACVNFDMKKTVL